MPLKNLANAALEILATKLALFLKYRDARASLSELERSGEAGWSTADNYSVIVNGHGFGNGPDVRMTIPSTTSVKQARTPTRSST
jgi:hypothetical protein